MGVQVHARGLTDRWRSGDGLPGLIEHAGLLERLRQRREHVAAGDSDSGPVINRCHQISGWLLSATWRGGAAYDVVDGGNPLMRWRYSTSGVGALSVEQGAGEPLPVGACSWVGIARLKKPSPMPARGGYYPAWAGSKLSMREARSRKRLTDRSNASPRVFSTDATSTWTPFRRRYWAK